jgi:anti-anti-sigma factor
MALPDLIQKEDQALRLTTEIVPGNARAVILSLNGYIDSYNSRQFLEQVLALIESGFHLAGFSCSEFRYISSTGIAAFTKIQNRFSEIGGELGILYLSDTIREVFGLLGIERFFSFFSDRQQALNWFNEFPFPESTDGPLTPALQNGSMLNLSKMQMDLLPVRRGETGAVLAEIHTETGNLEICGFFRPSPRFSGDYFQYYYADRLVLLIKCDASGHTPETAQVMIKTAALFNQTAYQILNLETQGQTHIDEYHVVLTNLRTPDKARKRDNSI